MSHNFYDHTDGIPEGAAVCLRQSPTGSGREVLLIRSTKSGEPWMFPKGHIEHKDPNPESCALRELEEETGYVAYPLYPAGVARVAIAALDYKIECFRCRIVGKVQAKDVARTYFWCPVEEAFNLLQYQQLRNVLAYVLEKEDKDEGSYCPV